MKPSHSLSPPRPSSSRRPSTHRRCEFGSDHVAKLTLELLEGDHSRKERALTQEIAEKNQELLQLHNELGEARATSEALTVQVQKLEKDIEQGVEDYNQAIEDFNQAVEERDANAAIIDRNREKHKKQLDLNQELKLQITELSQERDTLRAPKRERENSVDPAEVKRLKTESKDLRRRLTLLETVEEERKRLKEELERAHQLNKAFTPAPESQDQQLREELEEWEDAALQSLGPKPDETPWTPAEVRSGIEHIRRIVDEIKDLKPFSPLLPAGYDLKDKTIRDVASFLQEWYFRTLNELGNLLPDDTELITPTVSIPELGERLKERLKTAIRDSAKTRRLTLELSAKEQAYVAEEALAGKLGRELEQWRTQVGRALTLGPPDSGPSVEEAANAVKHLRAAEERADNLVIANQAIIFEWENAAIRLVPDLDQRQISPRILDDFGKKIKDVVCANFGYEGTEKPETASEGLARLLKEAGEAIRQQQESQGTKLQGLLTDLAIAQELVRQKGPLLDFYILLVQHLQTR